MTIGSKRVRPNKRLKLTGGDRSKGSGVFAPWRARDFVQHLLRWRASRPQRKRGSLGGGLKVDADARCSV